jgi:CO/xanthine dehydrogenase FAD-binding subunit
VDYFAPTDLKDALAALAEGAPSVIAGGTDWYPAQGERPQRGAMLDISRVSGLNGIVHRDGAFRIGATATWSDVIAADLPAAFDGLKAAAREVGSVQIQNAGTVAGNLCNASPAADGVPPLLRRGRWNWLRFSPVFAARHWRLMNWSREYLCRMFRTGGAVLSSSSGRGSIW